MNTHDVKKRARVLGLKIGRARKADLIRAIQQAEGNFACFGSAEGDCDRADCCWKRDCLRSRS